MNLMSNILTYENFIVEKKSTRHAFRGSLNRAERNEFIKKLQKNIIKFRYKKRDGSTRKAEGTLHPKFLPKPKSDKEFVRPEYQIVYYDIDKKDWRSFLSFDFIEILNTRPALSKIEHDEKKKIKDKSKKEKIVDKDSKDEDKKESIDEKDENVKDKKESGD